MCQTASLVNAVSFLMMVNQYMIRYIFYNFIKKHLTLYKRKEYEEIFRLEGFYDGGKRFLRKVTFVGKLDIFLFIIHLLQSIHILEKIKIVKKFLDIFNENDVFSEEMLPLNLEEEEKTTKEFKDKFGGLNIIRAVIVIIRIFI